MTSRRASERKEAEEKIVEWLKSHRFRWWRIPDVANAVNLPVPMATVVLADLAQHDTGVIRDTRKRKRNSKEYPVYQMRSFHAPENAPAWLCPLPPQLSPEQIKGIRTVLGFTGNMDIKKRLKESE